MTTGAAPEHRKQFARAWLNRGTVLQDEKRLNEAAKAYTEAIRIQEGLVEAFRDRAEAADLPDDHAEELVCSSSRAVTKVVKWD